MRKIHYVQTYQTHIFVIFSLIVPKLRPSAYLGNDFPVNHQHRSAPIDPCAFIRLKENLQLPSSIEILEVSYTFTEFFLAGAIYGHTYGVHKVTFQT